MVPVPRQCDHERHTQKKKGRFGMIAAYEHKRERRVVRTRAYTDDIVKNVHSRTIINGAVNGAMIIHIRNPFLCSGVRFSKRVLRWASGDEHAEPG